MGTTRYDARIDELSTAFETLESGASVTLTDGRVLTAADKKAVDLEIELLQLKRARLRIVDGEQELSVNDRRIRRADLAQLATDIQRLERQLATLQRSGITLRQVVPLDA